MLKAIDSIIKAGSEGSKISDIPSVQVLTFWNGNLVGSGADINPGGIGIDFIKFRIKPVPYKTTVINPFLNK